MSTAEERAADEALRAVLQTALESHDLARGVLTDVVVICAQQYYDGDGDPCTRVVNLYPGEPPHYRVVGLVEYAAARLRAEIVAADEIVE